MKLKELSQEELETMSYDDLAYIILEDHGKKMKLLDIFKKIAKALKMDESEIENRIADFFELMSTNKKFVMLEKGYWDLSSKHMKSVIVEDEEDIEIEHEEIEVEEDEKVEEIFYTKDESDDEEEDDLSDLVVIDPEDEETSL